MNTREVIEIAGRYLAKLPGHVFDVLTVSKPVSPDAALNLAKVISKLSPLLGNLIEFNTVELLNDRKEFQALGKWVRQDPDFPDTVFKGGVEPVPGFEIKAWFPLATEITARFKGSQAHFLKDNTYVALLAWLPQKLIFGKPHILGVCVVSGLAVAQARDEHYHDPPDYLVIEPGDTVKRTRNLQQTTTAGYKWQGSAKDFDRARRIVESWGKEGRRYKTTPEYQARLRELMAKFEYRSDSNFSKMDRIEQADVEAFKDRMNAVIVNGMTVGEWRRLLAGENDATIKAALLKHLDVKEVDADELLE